MHGAFRSSGLVLFCLSVWSAGCDTDWWPGSSDSAFFGETEDLFRLSAHSMSSQRQGFASFETTVDDEPTLYRLERPLTAGDRIVISVKLLSEDGPGPRVALFNADQEALAVDTRLESEDTVREVVIDQHIRSDGEYFVGLAMPRNHNTPRQVSGSVTYLSTIQKAPRPPQTILLNFDGGSVRIGEKTYSIPPFDAKRIDQSYANQTDNIKSLITRNVTNGFAPYRIFIKNTDDLQPVTEPHTTVYFGGSSYANLGISQQLDMGNRYCCDSAIIFTDRLARRFGILPSAADISMVIANVVCHETGHLLGLSHTDNPEDFMDISGDIKKMVVLRRYTMSPLHSSVFPAGMQNGAALLHANLAD